MTLLLFHTPPHLQSSPFLNLSFTLKPKTSPATISVRTPITATIPARDRVIDFGKHKGKMLGTLPQTYLKWVSKNLRARDFEEWAKLADEVLEDPVYNDRIEWEFADNVLQGNRKFSSIGNGNGGAVSELLEISERFGWDNEDKAGWKRINFQLLGTSKGGRIPRVSGRSSDGEQEMKMGLKEVEGSSGNGDKRRARMERMRKTRGVIIKEEKMRFLTGKKSNARLGFELRRDEDDDSNELELGVKSTEDVQFHSPFPGREALLKKWILYNWGNEDCVKVLKNCKKALPKKGGKLR